MKKVISCIVSVFIMISAIPTSAQDSFISLEPYPYSTHVLGEELVICGDTDFGNVTIGLYYPEDQGYMGMSKYIVTIKQSEFRLGHVISTEVYSRLWPEGEWKIVVQNGDIKIERYIMMTAQPQFDRTVRVAEYENGIMTAVSSYKCRGAVFSDNILSFTTPEGIEYRIFAWNNLAPTKGGEGRVFIATYSDGYMTDIRTYSGRIEEYGRHIELEISDTKAVKLFLWGDNLAPIP